MTETKTTETKIIETKIIAVVGAAGVTGGGLARAILADPVGGYACRAITRTPDSTAARALVDQMSVTKTIAVLRRVIFGGLA